MLAWTFTIPLFGCWCGFCYHDGPSLYWHACALVIPVFRYWSAGFADTMGGIPADMGICSSLSITGTDSSMDHVFESHGQLQFAISP